MYKTVACLFLSGCIWMGSCFGGQEGSIDWAKRGRYTTEKTQNISGTTLLASVEADKVHSNNMGKQNEERHGVLRIKLNAQWTAMTDKIIKILARNLHERGDVTLIECTPDEVADLSLNISDDLPKEGFRIEQKGDGWCIIGRDERGLLYGVGRFLRGCTWDGPTGWRYGGWCGTSAPRLPVRGIYFATHCHNFYHEAPVEEIERYVEDLALWGYNCLAIWYDMHHFTGKDDPKAAVFLSRLQKISKAASDIGLDVGIVVLGNEAYSTSPVELRATPFAVKYSRGGFYPEGTCPNKPGGLEYTLNVIGEYLDSMKSRGIDPAYLIIWPYDQGGCTCKQCSPWGTTGFIKCAKSISQMARKKFPHVRVVLSTWFMDDDEWNGLVADFSNRPNWLDAILGEFVHTQDKQAASIPGNLPMLGFPEISMYGMWPWGGFGANPLTKRCQTQWNWQKKIFQGGFPYSEGIYEDINKILWAQFYWDPERPAKDIIREYAAFEFSPKAADGVTEVVEILERNHHFRYWEGMVPKDFQGWNPAKKVKPQEDKDAEKAYEIMKELDQKLPKNVREGWRWRVLYLRALLDAELKMNNGLPTELCRQAFAELGKLYYVRDNTSMVLTPPMQKKGATYSSSDGGF